MYNPSRGGVRGGADQFTWESVKNDKHRENYLGHSLMAPVGRWQKGKDLSWYAKERKDTDKSEKSELASIKQAEEEAMLIALGHNVVKKSQTLSKEDMREALKRNTGERDDHSIERIDGVGASSQRVALLSGVGKDSRQKSDGVAFEGYRERKEDVADKNDAVLSEERKKMKKSKKHKKEKKHKKHREESSDSDSSEDDNKSSSKTLNTQKEKKHKKHHKESPGFDSSDCDERNPKIKNQKEKKHKKHHKMSYNSDHHDHSSKHTSKHKRDEFDSDDNKVSEVKSHKQKKQKKHHKESNDSDSSHDFSKHRNKHKRDGTWMDNDDRKFSNVKSHKKSKHKDNSHVKSGRTHYSKSNNEDNERYKNKTNPEKRRRHDTSESD